MSPERHNFFLKSVRIPAKKLLVSDPKFLAAGHVSNFQTSPSFAYLLLLCNFYFSNKPWFFGFLFSVRELLKNEGLYEI